MRPKFLKFIFWGFFRLLNQSLGCTFLSFENSKSWIDFFISLLPFWIQYLEFRKFKNFYLRIEFCDAKKPFREKRKLKTKTTQRKILKNILECTEESAALGRRMPWANRLFLKSMKGMISVISVQVSSKKLDFPSLKKIDLIFKIKK